MLVAVIVSLSTSVAAECVGADFASCTATTECSWDALSNSCITAQSQGGEVLVTDCTQYSFNECLFAGTCSWNYSADSCAITNVTLCANLTHTQCEVTSNCVWVDNTCQNLTTPSPFSGTICNAEVSLTECIDAGCKWTGHACIAPHQAPPCKALPMDACLQNSCKWIYKLDACAEKESSVRPFLNKWSGKQWE